MPLPLLLSCVMQGGRGYFSSLVGELDIAEITRTGLYPTRSLSGTFRRLGYSIEYSAVQVISAISSRRGREFSAGMGWSGRCLWDLWELSLDGGLDLGLCVLFMLGNHYLQGSIQP